MIVGEITVGDLLARLQIALDANDLQATVQYAKDLRKLSDWKEEYLQGGFRDRNHRKIEAVTAALRDIHRLDELGNNELYYKLILERWEEIDNDCEE